MYPQSKPATAADALRNPQRRPVQQVRRQGSVGMGGGMGGGVKPMGGSPYPPAPQAPRPMQPQRPQGVPMPTANSSFDPSGRPIVQPQKPSVVPYTQPTAIDALKNSLDTSWANAGQSDIGSLNPKMVNEVSAIPTTDLPRMLEMLYTSPNWVNNPMAGSYIDMIKRRMASLQGTAVPQPYTPNPNLTNQSQTQY